MTEDQKVEAISGQVEKLDCGIVLRSIGYFGVPVEKGKVKMYFFFINCLSLSQESVLLSSPFLDLIFNSLFSEKHLNF